MLIKIGTIANIKMLQSYYLWMGESLRGNMVE